VLSFDGGYAYNCSSHTRKSFEFNAIDSLLASIFLRLSLKTRKLSTTQLIRRFYMFRFAGVCTLMTLLLLVGCSSDEQQQTPAETQQQSTDASTAVDQAKQKAAEAVEKAKASVDEAKKAVEKTVDDAVKQGTASVESAKQELSEVSTAAEEKVSETTQEAVDQAKAATAPAVEKANDLMASSSQKMTDLTSSFQTQKEDLSTTAEGTAASSVQKVSEVAPPETIKLENNFGTVTLTHKFHGETYGCATCHGDSTPGPFELTKDLAHSSMCKDCHKGSGGPTGCTECHIK
jgi:uncharacterized protein YceK